jgi:predicted transcriptional regulator
MARQLSIKLDDELDTQIRSAAHDGSISEWMAEAARQRLTREMWEQYKKTADALGINDPNWMARELTATEQAQRATG